MKNITKHENFFQKHSFSSNRQRLFLIISPPKSHFCTINDSGLLKPNVKNS